MRIDRRKAVAVCIAALASLAAAPKTGDRAPALVLPTIDGRVVDLAALRGKVVVVNFWATWCPPCRVEMPALDAWYRARRGQGIEVVGVSEDKPSARDKVKEVMQPFAYPAGLASDARQIGFAPAAALPITYVIDRKGVVRAVLTPENGALTGPMLDQIVRPLL